MSLINSGNGSNSIEGGLNKSVRVHRQVTKTEREIDLIGRFVDVKDGFDEILMGTLDGHKEHTG